MAVSKTRFRKGLVISPDSDALEGIEGEIKLDSSDKKFKVTTNSTARELLDSSSTQTVTNKTIDADSNTITNIENADIKAAAAIDASKLADGSVSNAEFQYLSNVTSDIQTQINTASGAAGTAQTDINNHIADAVDAHDASAISSIPSGNLAATEVQAALNELQTDVDTRALASDLTNHINDAVDAHDASAISNIPSGNLAATEVQAALNELQTDVDTRALNSDLTTHTGASTGVHGVTGSVVGTSDSQVLTNKTITGADFRTPLRSDVKQDTKANLTTYALTASNGQLVFATDTKELFQIVDGLLKAAGGTGGAADVNALLIQTFDTAAVSDFTQTGLSLSTTNTINGAQSAALTHQPATNQSFKQTIAVDRKFRAQQMTLSLNVRSTATSGNLTVQIQDETNAVSVMASSQIQTSSNPFTANTNSNTTLNSISNADMAVLAIGDAVTGSGIPVGAVITALGTNQVTISAAATATASAVSMRASSLPARRPFTFVIPANCASLSYTVTALPEANSPRSVIDDVVIELTSNSLLETSVVVPVMTEWQGYTPIFQGFGTPSAIEFEWRQVGENVEIRGKFTSGTTTGVEARISLPNGYTSATTSLIPSLQVAGTGIVGDQSTTYFGLYSLIEPSVSYLTLGLQSSAANALSKINGSAFGNTKVMTLTASVPVLGLSATTTKTIALTQSGLIQDADSMIRLDTANGYGSTATKIRRFTNIRQNIGSDILYQDSATNGASFTALTSGVYSVSFSDSTTSSASIGLTLNSSQLTTNIFSVTPSTLLVSAYISIGTATTDAVWTGYLNAGDIIRAHTDGIVASGTPATFTMSRQGSLKQVTVNTNSKITIPTSELRFEGASARGAVATAIVKFDTLAKIRGDAFTVTNTANDGTFVTMLKAGRLNASANVYGSAINNAMYLTRNQAVLTADPVISEVLSSSYVVSQRSIASLAWSGDVSVGDTIRISANQAPASGFYNSLNLSFQEQEIQVGITNILPQFSESDSSVRVDTANSYGSTGTKIRRFSNVRDNIGVDVEYVDSATNGASFTAKSSGIYNISYSDNPNAAGGVIALSKNASSLTTSPLSLATSEVLGLSAISTVGGYIETVSWQGYLVAGDIIRGQTSGEAAATAASCTFTMSKVGKPNVTGVNVTPFVNVPQPVTDSLLHTAAGNTLLDRTGEVRFAIGSVSTTSRGVIGIEDDSANSRTKFVALKACTISVSFNAIQAVAANVSLIYKNGAQISVGSQVGTINYWSQASAHLALAAGEFITVGTSGGVANDGNGATLTMNAEALSDQILTAPETFSTDTVALTYAGSGTYTLATLANAPVGTFITYTYAVSTNTRTQTTTAPTQTTADMNANGMLIYARAYNAASTAAQPAAIAIQIGKGLKGKSLDLYKSAGKVTEGSLDFVVTGTSVQKGIGLKNYNEVTGILFIDAGFNELTTNTNSLLYFSDISNQASGYLVINASKNPALTGLNLNRVAARGVSTSGQSIPNSTLTVVTYDAAKTFDTNGALNAATGVFTAPETGYYQVNGLTGCNPSVAANIAWIVYIHKNGVQYSSNDYRINATSIPYRNISDIVFLNKNDTVDMRIFQNSGGAAALNASAGINYFSVTKVSL